VLDPHDRPEHEASRCRQLGRRSLRIVDGLGTRLPLERGPVHEAELEALDAQRRASPAAAAAALTTPAASATGRRTTARPY
jgi:hypothetical protein